MKQFIIAFLIFLVWAIFGFWLYTSVGTSKEHDIIASKEDFENKEESKIDQNIMDSLNIESPTIVSDTETSAKEEGFKAVTYQGDVVFLYDKGIHIKKNTSDLTVPPGVLDFKYKLNTYLIEHPDQELHILAFYDPSENLETPSYGEQRGMKMLTLLSKTGILTERMVVKPTIKKMEFDTLDGYSNGIGFVFRPIDKERLNASNALIPPPRPIYPKFSSNNIYANEELKELIPEIQLIFAANPNISVEIIGHTDNIGNGIDNFNLGLRYAQQVRWYLINKGNLDKDRIKALSKGEDEPIADNDFREGRLQNRRIEIKYILN